MLELLASLLAAITQFELVDTEHQNSSQLLARTTACLIFIMVVIDETLWRCGGMVGSTTGCTRGEHYLIRTRVNRLKWRTCANLI